MPRVVINQAGAGTTTLVAAIAGRLFAVTRVVLTLSAAGTVQFSDGTDALTGPFDVAANGGFVLPADNVNPWFATAALGRALQIVTTGGAARGVLDYINAVEVP